MHIPPPVGQPGRIPDPRPEDSWNVRRLRAILAQSCYHDAAQEAGQLCPQVGWPFQDIFQYAVRAFVARTPEGIVFRVVPLGHLGEPLAAMEPGYRLADLDAIFGPLGELSWESVLSFPEHSAFWESLPEGITPLLDANTSRHANLAQRGSWMQGQQDIPRWSGQVACLPRDVSMQGTDIALIALRQGRCVAVLETGGGDMDALVSLDPRIPLPKLRATGVYVRAGD